MSSTSGPKVVQPVGREQVLHSEPSIYHPTADAHPELDERVSSVPSAKKYVLWLLIALAFIAAFLLFVFLS